MVRIVLTFELLQSFKIITHTFPANSSVFDPVVYISAAGDIGGPWEYLAYAGQSEAGCSVCWRLTALFAEVQKIFQIPAIALGLLRWVTIRIVSKHVCSLQKPD